MKEVERVVPKSKLSIKRSVFDPKTVNAPKYQDDPVANQYWPDWPAERNRPEDVTSCPAQNQYGISFDDGPTPETPRVIEGLKKIGTKATFFVMGGNARANPEELKQVVAAGHEVGIHSWNHL